MVIEFSCLNIEGKVEVLIEWSKSKSRKSEMSAFSLMIFWEYLYPWNLRFKSFLNLNLKLLSIFVPNLHVKRKKEISAACSMLLLFDYAWVISLFCNGFNDWIIDVILNRIRVRHSAILRLLTILEEEVLRIWAAQQLWTTSSWYSFVSFSFFVTFFHQDYYNFFDFLIRDIQ